MNELDLARDIAKGKALSPSRLGASWLFALRISGTGLAFRTDERVWRDPAEWTKPEMLQRCNGLSVIWEHPPGKTLTSGEFADRVIGAVNLPYTAGRDGIQDAEGNQVWGVARIFDEAAATLMASEPCSTSPCVVFTKGNEGVRFGNLLMENQPAQLDHVAICGRGVWDTGDVSGVRIDTNKPIEKDTAAMADSETKDEGTAKILEVLDSICKRLDSSDTRMQALESAEADRRKKADEIAAAGAGAGDPMTNGVAMGAEADKRKRADMDATGLDARNPPGVDEYAEMQEAQAAADAVCSVFGDRAPPVLRSESIPNYHRRIARKYQHHSPDTAKIDLSVVPNGPALDLIVGKIYADAIKVGSSPAFGTEGGRLREVVRTDAAGRRISEFYGSPRAWMQDFRSPPQYVTKINRNPDE